MIITLAEIERQFDKWNNAIFSSELPRPTFELIQTKCHLGQFHWRKIGSDKMGYSIRISVFYDRPLEAYVDTIVHEMLHYYIKYKGIKDTSSHGRIWKAKAAEISRRFNLNISRTNPAGGGASDAVLEKKASKGVAKYEYVFVCKMKDGYHYGAGVVPSSKVHKFVPGFTNWKAVAEFKVVKAPWSQTYSLRHLRTCVGVGYVTKEQYDELLRNKVLDY